MVILQPGQQLAVWMGQEAHRPNPTLYRAVYRGVIDSRGKRHTEFDTAKLRKRMCLLADVEHHSDRPRHLCLGYDRVLAREENRVFDVLTNETIEEDEEANGG